jgi:hypothetical protein
MSILKNKTRHGSRDGEGHLLGGLSLMRLMSMGTNRSIAAPRRRG